MDFPLSFGAQARGLGEFLHHAVALQPREVIDEQHAVEMVDLVLEADGEQAVGLQFLRLAVAIEVAHAHRPGARRPRNIRGSTGSLPR